jgi:hypothetical protein
MSEDLVDEREPRALLLKCFRDEDFYVAWSESGEEPEWYGTRAQAAEYGFADERIARADLNGTSSQPMIDHENMIPWAGGPFYRWDDPVGPIARQRGHVPRRYLRAFAVLYLDAKEEAAFDLLEPFEDDVAQVLHAH